MDTTSMRKRPRRVSAQNDDAIAADVSQSEPSIGIKKQRMMDDAKPTTSSLETLSCSTTSSFSVCHEHTTNDTGIIHDSCSSFSTASFSRDSQQSFPSTTCSSPVPIASIVTPRTSAMHLPALGTSAMKPLIHPINCTGDTNIKCPQFLVPMEEDDACEEQIDPSVSLLDNTAIAETPPMPHCLWNIQRSRQTARPALSFPLWRTLLQCALAVLFIWHVHFKGRWLSFPLHHPDSRIDHRSVCVSGGGFSGFWFTLGRLNSIPDPTARTYHCYSAGCLGVVATLNNYTMQDMSDMAFGIQDRWKTGEITRYQVVTAFVNELLPVVAADDKNDKMDATALSRMNILTTVPDGWYGLQYSSRTPTSIDDLRTMLVQTAWIPFAIGDDLWYDGHMDGAFSVAQHPTCRHNLGLAKDLDLLANVVNVNLSAEKVAKFWRKGLAYGL